MSDSDERKDFVFKITVIGDGGVGKTSLIKKYTKGSFKKEYIKTLGENLSYNTNDRTFGEVAFIDDDLIIMLRDDEEIFSIKDYQTELNLHYSFLLVQKHL